MDDSQVNVMAGTPDHSAPANPGPGATSTNGQQFALALAFMAAVAVLALAAYLRLTSLDLIQFTREEIAQLQLSGEWLQSPGLALPEPATMPASAGSPFSVYLLSIPLAFVRDPLLAAGFVACLNLLAVLGGYLLARRYFGEAVALISTLLYAVAPWAVIHARRINPSGFLPLFAVLFFYALFRTFVERRTWYLVLAFLWLGVLLQIHPSAGALIPVLALALLLYWRRLKPLPLAAGLLVGLVTLTPALHHGATHAWANLWAWVPGGGASGQPVAGHRLPLDLAAVRYSLQMATGAGLETLAGQGLWRFQAGRPSLRWLDLAEQALIVIGALYLFVRILVDRVRTIGRPMPSRAVGYSLILLWFLIPLLANLRHPPGLEPGHLSFLYPSQFLIVAIFLVAVATWVTGLLMGLHAALRRAVLARGWSAQAQAPSRGLGLAALAAGYVLPVMALAALATWQFQTTGDFHRFLDYNAIEGGYGTPIRYHLEVTDKARKLSQDLDNRQVMILAENLDPGQSDLLVALDYLFGSDVQPKYLDARQNAFVFPASQGRDSLYLALPGDGPGESFLNRFGTELTDQAVVLPGGDSVVRFYRLPPASTVLPPPPSGMPISMGDALTLLMAEMPRETQPGDTLPLTLTWTIRAVTPDSPHYAFFNHLVDERGEKWVQDDGTEYNPYQWEVGETAVSWYRLRVPPDTPPGRYWVLTGLYRVTDLKRLPLTGPGGEALGDHLRLGPIKVARPRAAWEAEAAAMEKPARADLAGKVTLLGYDLPDRFPSPGGLLRLTLYWQAQVSMDHDYTVFAHLLDSEGRLRAQHDGQPQGGQYPTSIWAPGEIVRDSFDIVVPPDTPVGTYQLRVGLYDLATMERLQVREGPPGVMDDSILLAEVVVVP